MPEKLKAYAELLRVSNVLTAVADVWMGMIVATGTLAPAWVSVPLTAASVCLYLGGMALNDLLDAPRDAKQRSSRPIPSGRVSPTEAKSLTAALLVAGISCGGLTAWAVGHVAPLAFAVALLIFIWLYDAAFKASPLAPLNMGACRALNVCLGLSVGGPSVWQVGMIAPGVLLYVVGLTLFARREERQNRRLPLIAAAVVSGVGLTTLAAAPLSLGGLSEAVPETRWIVLWLVVTLLVGRRYVAAILQPTPRHIQGAVGNAIQGIILIDAALAWGYVGPYWGLAIFALLPPTMLMARFIPQT